MGKILVEVVNIDKIASKLIHAQALMGSIVFFKRSDRNFGI
ncbi:hypothetical protein [Candidatus Enterovibrio escicola]